MYYQCKHEIEMYKLLEENFLKYFICLDKYNVKKGGGNC